jgi:hypothetical protein
VAVAVGQGGLLGPITAQGPPGAGLFFAIGAASLLLLAALAVLGIWVPAAWWRWLAGAGAMLSMVLMILFFGVTKLLPIAVGLFILWVVASQWWSPAMAA